MNLFIREDGAIYIFCDGAMDYDGKSTGGVGFSIEFPESMQLPSVQRTIGRYEMSTIDRLELHAINEGMKELLRIFKKNK